ncbi:hypothetical protein B0T17DRAFT_614416 [Bombardia bombarda]|uniref:Uncharacterized protein n=1 Tax=Bombardia bombarda TaxID=252184 RepID=A0AA39X728_9PEZI|nr:hypothetical protein B0T17DRAFT_614416 [Bombardia bombarda]
MFSITNVEQSMSRFHVERKLGIHSDHQQTYVIVEDEHGSNKQLSMSWDGMPAEGLKTLQQRLGRLACNGAAGAAEYRTAEYAEYAAAGTMEACQLPGFGSRLKALTGSALP